MNNTPLEYVLYLFGLFALLNVIGLAGALRPRKYVVRKECIQCGSVEWVPEREKQNCSECGQDLELFLGSHGDREAQSDRGEQ